MENETAVQVILTNLENNPQCPHGPTLLFTRSMGKETRSFYACSACRDRKDCSFFHWADTELSESKLRNWENERNRRLPEINHNQLIKRLNKITKLPPTKRAYCHTCNSLVLTEERSNHSKHDLQLSISDQQLLHPSEFLKPLESSRKEAQYLFAKNSIKVIVDALQAARLKKVLCIGAPRIHEYINSEAKDSMSSLLLDIDHRYHQFYTEDKFRWFNSFNCHFFTSGGKEVVNKFMADEEPSSLGIVTDPPFGGRAEPLSWSFQKIDKWHLELHPKRKKPLAVLWIFPYFMEPQIVGCNPNMRMLDYKVDYDNHPLFQKGPKGRKQGSPVRIFTNLDPSNIPLPAEEGYRHCEFCLRWVSSENKHCFKCNACSSKDGRTYVHCDRCNRCVKPTWQHCSKCRRCCLPKHDCEFVPQVGLCFACHQPGHKKSECPLRSVQDHSANRPRPKKRKKSTDDKRNAQKKRM